MGSNIQPLPLTPTMKLARLLLLASSAVALPALAGAQVLLNDPLNNTVRNNQNLPHEAAWYKGGGGNVVLNPTASGMEFYRSDAGTSRLLATNFVDSTAGYTLAIGEVLRMDYTFKASAVPSGNAFNTDNRMGLISFAGAPAQRLSADNSSANGPTVTNLTGYVIFFHLSDALASQPFTINKVNTAGTGTFSTAASFIALDSPTTLVEPTGGLVSGTEYTLRFDIARVSDTTVNVTATYLDNVGGIIASVMATDTAAATPTYDGFVYRSSTNANFGGTQTLTNFSVSVIPEPSTYAAIFGLGVLGFVAMRRRKQR